MYVKTVAYILRKKETQQPKKFLFVFPLKYLKLRKWFQRWDSIQNSIKVNLMHTNYRLQLSMEKRIKKIQAAGFSDLPAINATFINK